MTSLVVIVAIVILPIISAIVFKLKHYESLYSVGLFAIIDVIITLFIDLSVLILIKFYKF